MRMYRTLIGYAFAALAFLGYSGFGYAADAYPLTQTIRHAIADAGHYGACVAKAEAELTYMVSVDSVSSSAGDLIKMSNGFVQKSLTVREVAEGTSGSTAISQLS